MFILTNNKFLRTVSDERAVLILKWLITDCDANSFVIHRRLPHLFRLFVFKCLQAVRSVGRYVFQLSAYWFNYVSKNDQHVIVNLKMKLTQKTL